MPDVITAAGDCFSSIARAQGFYNYRSIYTHDTNAANFPNPNQVEAGSTVKVPEKVMKAFDLPVDAEKRFKIVRKATRFEIRICKAAADQIPAIASATLQLGKKTATGTTGTLKIDDIDPTIKSATLKVVLSKPAPFADPPATQGATAGQLPPAISVDDFDDPKTVWPAKGETITWTLKVGSLEPSTLIRGVLQRLENFGFSCPVQQAEDPATKLAIRSYQRFVESKVKPGDTGTVTDIQAGIKTRHDTA